MKTFKEVLAWQKAYEFTLLVYKYTSDFPRSEEFGLKSQLRRAAVSVISNFAEGYKRKGEKEKLHFYNQSEASLEEAKCQIMLSHDLKYIDDEANAELENISSLTGRLLYGWIESYKSPLNR